MLECYVLLCRLYVVYCYIVVLCWNGMLCYFVLYSVVLCWNGMLCYVVLHSVVLCWNVMFVYLGTLVKRFYFYILVILADAFIQSDIWAIQIRIAGRHLAFGDQKSRCLNVGNSVPSGHTGALQFLSPAIPVL